MMQADSMYVLILENKYKLKSKRNGDILKYVRDIYKIPESQRLELKKDTLGKPYVAGLDVEISITHSGIYLVVALGRKRLGVDIEEVKPIDFTKIMYYLFSEREIRKTAQDLALFYDTWVKKESYTKMLGKGMLLPFKDFSVDKIEHVVFQKISVDSTYICYVCYDKNDYVQIELLSKVGREP